MHLTFDRALSMIEIGPARPGAAEPLPVGMAVDVGAAARDDLIDADGMLPPFVIVARPTGEQAIFLLEGERYVRPDTPALHAALSAHGVRVAPASLH